MYGSKSGFDSIDEAYGEFARNIYAVETGLSSDPAMNWSVSELDRRMILSFSDAHSGPKLGREATVFQLKNKGKGVSDKSYSYNDVYRKGPGGGDAAGKRAGCRGIYNQAIYS